MARRIIFISVLQTVFYGLRLLSATRVFWAHCRVELVGVSLKEGGGCDQLVNGRGERRRAAWRKPDSQAAKKMFWCRPPLFCSGKAVGPLEFGG